MSLKSKIAEIISNVPYKISCDDATDRIIKLIIEVVPREKDTNEYRGDYEWCAGYNAYRTELLVILNGGGE
jgi:hypothetical protein